MVDQNCEMLQIVQKYIMVGVKRVGEHNVMLDWVLLG